MSEGLFISIGSKILHEPILRVNAVFRDIELFRNDGSDSQGSFRSGIRNGGQKLVVADEAIHWLAKERDPQKPFFMTVWTHEPHLPIESDPEFMTLYADLDDPDLRQHHGNVTQLDHAFGKLMRALDAQGLRDYTFVIFTSDNGPKAGETKGGREVPQAGCAVENETITKAVFACRRL